MRGALTEKQWEAEQGKAGSDWGQQRRSKGSCKRWRGGLKGRGSFDSRRQGLGGWRSVHYHYEGSRSRKYLEIRQPGASSDAAEESAICTCKYVL